MLMMSLGSASIRDSYASSEIKDANSLASTIMGTEGLTADFPNATGGRMPCCGQRAFILRAKCLSSSHETLVTTSCEQVGCFKG